MVAIIFYDFEVFKYNWMVHFIDVVNKKEITIVDNRDKLIEFYNENKDSVFVGFNNLHYDQYIFKGILLGMNPSEINDFIINKKEPGWKFSKAFWNVKMIQYDCFSGYYGLKQLEAFMGHSIIETSVPFDIDRPLTGDEIVEVIKYCKYDVEQTIEVFMRRQKEYQSKMDLIKEFKLPITSLSKTNAQLSAEALQTVRQKRTDEWNINDPKELKLSKYNHIRRWYLNPVNHDYSKSYTCNISGIEHVLAWGGLHGAINNFIEEGNFVLLDVNSFYPTMMIEYDYISRNISDKNHFKNIYDERFRLKRLEDEKQSVYKAILNITYGCMGFKGNPLYDPLMRNNVCITGQLLLVDLIEKLEQVKGIKLIQSTC